MKALILPFAIFSSVALYAQAIITKNIISIDTKEKNAKTIIFAKKHTEYNTYFVLQAKNETSKDFSKCKWTSNLTQDEVAYFANALSEIEKGTTFECSLFILKYKKNRINVSFNNTKCTSEHKIYYFQKSCKRSLSFILHTNQIVDIISSLNNALNKEHFTKK